MPQGFKDNRFKLNERNWTGRHIQRSYEEMTLEITFTKTDVFTSVLFKLQSSQDQKCYYFGWFSRRVPKRMFY